MPDSPAFPAGLALVRTTPDFDEHTVPAALLSAHRVADGVWGRLVVRSGSLRFVFETGPGRIVHAGETQAIPPGVPHHVEVVGPVAFAVEFHR
jgi:tellurite resistance-related uncharacterized protein